MQAFGKVQVTNIGFRVSELPKQVSGCIHLQFDFGWIGFCSIQVKLFSDGQDVVAHHVPVQQPVAHQANSPTVQPTHLNAMLKIKHNTKSHFFEDSKVAQTKGLVLQAA